MKLTNFCGMKVYEMLKLGAETLKTMSQNGIFLNDYLYVDAYEKFCHMRSIGIKYDCAIMEISDEMKIAKRTLQRAFKRLSAEC